MNENSENSIEETVSQDGEQSNLSIEPRGIEKEDESTQKQVGIEGEILPDETFKTEETSNTSSNTTVADDKTETTSLTEQTKAPNGMSIPYVGLSILQCVVAFLLIVVVLQQSKSASGMTSSTMIGNAESKSYWNQNKGRSKESKLARMTVILGVIFFIVTIALGFIR